MKRKDTVLPDFGTSSQCCVLDVSELLNYDPQHGRTLAANSFAFLANYLTTLSLQRSAASESHNFIDYSLTNVPAEFTVSLEGAFSRPNSIVEILKLTVTKVSPKLSLKVGQEYKCCECGHCFPAWADVLQFNRIPPPSTCFPRGQNKGEIPSSKAVGTMLVKTKCESSEFVAVANGEIYTDYVEVKLTDGVNCVKGVVLGTSHTDVAKGDEVTIIGAIGLRWLKDPNPCSVCECEFILQVASVRKTPKVTIHHGLSNFSKFLDGLRLFQRRSVIVRSSFTRVYGEYDLKLAGLLALVCHFSGSACSVLIAGPRGTGKTLFLKSMEELGRSYVVKHHTSGMLSTESGGKLLTIDNFHLLKDRRRLAQVMDTTSVVAAITSFHGSEGADKETRKSKQLYTAGLTRCNSLSADLDRFDLIIFQPFGHEDDIQYVQKILCDDQMETLDDTWASDTIFEYLQSIACPLADVQMESRHVEDLIHNFVGSIVRINMSQTQTQSGVYISARLVESLIKLARAHAVLLGHKIVTKFDVVSCIMLMLQMKSAEGGSEVLDEDVFMEKLEEINRVHTGVARL